MNGWSLALLGGVEEGPALVIRVEVVVRLVVLDALHHVARLGLVLKIQKFWRNGCLVCRLELCPFSKIRNCESRFFLHFSKMRNCELKIDSFFDSQIGSFAQNSESIPG